MAEINNELVEKRSISHSLIRIIVIGFFTIYFTLTGYGLYYHHFHNGEKDCMVSYVKNSYPVGVLYIQTESELMHIDSPDIEGDEFFDLQYSVNGCNVVDVKFSQLHTEMYCYVTLFNYRILKMYS